MCHIAAGLYAPIFTLSPSAGARVGGGVEKVSCPKGSIISYVGRQAPKIVFNVVSNYERGVGPDSLILSYQLWAAWPHKNRPDLCVAHAWMC